MSETKIEITPTPESAKNINSYSINEIIGRGSYGVVFKATDKETGKHVAIKRIPIGDITNEMETSTLQTLQDRCGEFFLCLFYVFQDNNYLYLVSENLDQYLHLSDFLFRQPNESFESFYERAESPKHKLLRPIILCNLVRAVEVLHELKIAHNDLHERNILVDTKTGQIKIIDFGLSTTGSDFAKDISDLLRHAIDLGFEWPKKEKYDREKVIPKVKQFACK